MVRTDNGDIQIARADGAGHLRVTNEFRDFFRVTRPTRLPGGIVYDRAAAGNRGVFFFNQRNADVNDYNPADPSSYYSELHPRLRAEGKTASIRGFVRGGSVPYGGRYRVTSEQGPVGVHVTVAVNSEFSDPVNAREADAERAAAKAEPAFHALMVQAGAGIYTGSITLEFILSGDQRDLPGLAEERTDGGLYQRSRGFTVYPGSNIRQEFMSTAREIMNEVKDDYGGSIDHVFYGVDAWRLNRVVISAVRQNPGNGGVTMQQLVETRLPVFLACAHPRQKILYCPEDDKMCFISCLRRAFERSKGSHKTDVIVPPGFDYTLGVHAIDSVVNLWASTNDCTINVFTAASEVQDGDHNLVLPFLLTPKGANLPAFHIDLLFFDDHWILIQSLSAIMCPPCKSGRRRSRKLCRHCLHKIEGKHQCLSDSTSSRLIPAEATSFFKAKRYHHTSKLSLPVVGVLRSSDDEKWEFGTLFNPLMDSVSQKTLNMTLTRAGDYSVSSVVDLIEMSDTVKLLRKTTTECPSDRKEATVKHCEACHTRFDETVPYFQARDPVFGSHIAWLCHACSDASQYKELIIVTSHLDEFSKQILLESVITGRVRLRFVGDWKRPLAIHISWRGSTSSVKLISAAGFAINSGESLDSMIGNVATVWTDIQTYLGVEPFRMLSAAQVAEAAFLSSPHSPKISLPKSARAVSLFDNRVGGLVYCNPGYYRKFPGVFIGEFDVRKCFCAVMLDGTATHFDETPQTSDEFIENWDCLSYSDCWIEAQVLCSGVTSLRDIGLPPRVVKGLPVPQQVLVSLKRLGATVTPRLFYRLKREPIHRPLMNQLLSYHSATGSVLAKSMMVSSYGKLAQRDGGWPSLQEIRSPRDKVAGVGRPSFKIDLVRPATDVPLDNTWEIVPTDTCPQSKENKKNPVRSRLEFLRRRLSSHTDITVCRVFNEHGYIIVMCSRPVLDSVLQSFAIPIATVSQACDSGLEMAKVCPKRQRVISRPVYPGQDIAMRSWVYIYDLLHNICTEFGSENVVVIRVMIDCLTVQINHGVPSLDVPDLLRQKGVLGDGIAPGSFKDEFEGSEVSEWFMVNPCAYEAIFSSKTDPSARSSKRRLGGLPQEDKDRLPENFFRNIVALNEPMTINSRIGKRTYKMHNPSSISKVPKLDDSILFIEEESEEELFLLPLDEFEQPLIN